MKEFDKTMHKTDLEYLYESFKIGVGNIHEYRSCIDCQPMPCHYELCLRNHADRFLFEALAKRIKLLDSEKENDLELIKKIARGIDIFDYERVVNSYSEDEYALSLIEKGNHFNNFSEESYDKINTLYYSLCYKDNVLQENHNNNGYHIHFIEGRDRTSVIFTYKNDRYIQDCNKKKHLFIETHAEGKNKKASIGMNSSDNVKKAIFRACGYLAHKIECSKFKNAGEKADIFWSLAPLV